MWLSGSSAPNQGANREDDRPVSGLRSARSVFTPGPDDLKRVGQVPETGAHPDQPLPHALGQGPRIPGELQSPREAVSLQERCQPGEGKGVDVIFPRRTQDSEVARGPWLRKIGEEGHAVVTFQRPPPIVRRGEVGS